MPSAPRKPAAQKKDYSPGLFVEEKKKSAWWKVALPLVLLAAVGLFFLLKPSADEQVGKARKTTPVAQVESTPPEPSPEELAAAEEARQAEARAEEQRLEEERLAEQQSQQEADRLATEAARRRQEDRDRRQREADEQRLAEEEQARLDQEAAEQAELERLAAEAAEARERERLAEEERQREEERRRIEAARAREGDVVPLADVQREPAAVTTPTPVIPKNLIDMLPSDQSVVASYLIDHRGNVESVRLVRQTPMAQINKIVQDTIMTWKFTPAVKDQVNVKVWKTFSFTIKKQ